MAFSARQIRGSAVFLAAIAAEALVVGVFVSTSVSFLWYNVIGCVGVLAFSGALQVALPKR